MCLLHGGGCVYLGGCIDQVLDLLAIKGRHECFSEIHRGLAYIINSGPEDLLLVAFTLVLAVKHQETGHLK